MHVGYILSRHIFPLVSNQPELHTELHTVLEKLSNFGAGRKSMLTCVVTQFMTSSVKSRQSKPPVNKLVEGLVNQCSKQKLDVEAFVEGGSKLWSSEFISLIFSLSRDIYIS